METNNQKQHPPDGEIGAVIPHEILSRTDLPLYVKLVYGRVAVILRRSGYAVLTTGELAGECGIRHGLARKALRYLVMLGLIRFHRSLTDHNAIHVFQQIRKGTQVCSQKNPIRNPECGRAFAAAVSSGFDAAKTRNDTCRKRKKRRRTGFIPQTDQGGMRQNSGRFSQFRPPLHSKWLFAGDQYQSPSGASRPGKRAGTFNQWHYCP